MLSRQHYQPQPQQFSLVLIGHKIDFIENLLTRNQGSFTFNAGKPGNSVWANDTQKRMDMSAKFSKSR